MAKIEITNPNEDESRPASVETVAVRVWGLGGRSAQQFYIGSGLNFSAAGNIWLEIQYSVQGAHLFYTRNFLHYSSDLITTPQRLEWLEKFAAGESDGFGFGDMLPETGLSLKREKFDWQGETQSTYSLEISADMGAVFGESAPGKRMVTIQLKDISLEEGVQFMRDLIHEIECAYQGRHPDPAGLSPDTSEWAFARQLNRQAYDLVSENYQEHYFDNPLLAGFFEGWLDGLPAGGRLLDAGCGHGDPVITRLLERGFQVTGIDSSPKMLRRAQERFPGVPFFYLPVTALESAPELCEAGFDGACSLSSMLYLDPVDFFNGIYRLYRALKPGATLLLYGYDLHPGYRGVPYRVDIHQWMWSWTYSLDEAVAALEEHGYFEVLQTRDVTTAEDKERSAERWRKNEQESYDKFVHDLLPEYPAPPPPDLTKIPANLAYCYAIVARRTGEEDCRG